MKPTVFAISIGGYTGAYYSVELNRGSLLYICWRDRIGEKYRITPSMGAWIRFWERLDEIGFWSWSGAYTTSGILDGTRWSVDVSLRLQSVQAHGSNAYPPASSHAGEQRKASEMSPEFEEFCEAVSELLGGLAFG